MVIFEDKLSCYIDKLGVLLFFILLAFLATLSWWFVFIGLIGIVLVTVNTRGVVLITEEYICIEHYFFKKEHIPINRIVRIYFEKIYTRTTTSYYVSIKISNGKSTIDTFLIHYRITGKDKIVDFLNFFEGKTEIDYKSFEQYGILFDGHKFYKK